MRMTGIRRVGKGKYKVRVTATCPRTGKRKEAQRTVVGNKDDALAAQQEMRDELLDPQTRERVRLATYARLWLNARLDVLKPSTARKYANDLEGHIIPVLGDFYVDALVPSDIQAFVSAQTKPEAKTGRRKAGWSIVGRLRLLRTIAKDALAEGLADIEFTARVRPPEVRNYDADDPNLLTADELGNVLANIPSQWYALVLLMATTGLRWGEASGLTWDDIDFDGLLVKVRRTNWKGMVHSPKTRKSNRDPALAPAVAEALKAHRVQMVASQHPGMAEGWVFPTAEGTLHKGTPLRKVLERALANAKIDKRLTPHGLRRTFNNLARQVTSHEVLKAITGHATDKMVEHYSVVSADEKKEAAAGVLRLLKLPKKD